MTKSLEALITGLKLAIKSATPGQWSFARSGANMNVQAPVNLQRGGAAKVVLCGLKSSQWRNQLATAHDAAFIALANPENIALLIAELESLCVNPDTTMRGASPLCVKLPDASSKAFWSGGGKTEKFHPETYKRWVKEAIERAGDIAKIKIEVK